MQHDIHVTIAAERLTNAGYWVRVDLKRDKIHAYIGKLELLRIRIKNACLPEHKIWQAEKGAEMLRAAGKL